ncbi:MAG: DNA-protecting protein DprA [Kofleriaceae bacterium]|nr:DNA-protecting protein DprA [Kofleriaceae bacterium]
MHLTGPRQVANCFPPVSTSVLNSGTFPRRLSALGWKPQVYVRGTQLGDGPAVAIVGARAATQAAMEQAHQLARHLATCGVHIVSGGALGIDGAAHRGALAGGGTTTVVLGSGVDVLYPQRHAELFCEVLARGGSLVSMRPEGAQPLPGAFVARNRLIAALVDAVLVVEADVQSGSLSTAKAALDLGRHLGACPGSPGTDRLIAAGAGIVEDTRDVERLARGELRHEEPEPLDPTEASVRDAMLAGATSVDAIVHHTGLAVRAVLRALPRLQSSFHARKQ